MPRLPINLLEAIRGIVKIRMEYMMNRILLLSLLSLSVSVAACSGGDGGGNSNSSSPSAASTERIVYLADQDINDVSELYLAGSSIKLNPPLSPGKNILDFQITPDKTAVVYRADQDTDEVFELYRVEFAHPGVSAKLNSPLPVGGDVWSAVIAPDSSSVLYLADQTTEGVLELYRVPFSTPGVSTKLNGPLVSGGNVFFGIGITPDNSAVVYRATEDTANTIELYRVPLATPGLSTKLNGVLPPNADVDSFKFTPNGASVVYTKLERGLDDTVPPFISFRSDLYRVPFATPGQSTQLNPPLEVSSPSFMSLIFQYDITPDSSAVVYVLEDAASDQRSLYRVPFATPGQSTQLTGSGANRFISTFAIRPDSSGVVYGAPLFAQTGNPELYFVPFTTPGVSTKLSGPLVAGGLVQFFAIAPDNSSVVYVAGPDLSPTGFVIRELYRVPFATPGVSTKLNSPLVAGGTVSRLFQNGPLIVTPDSSAVLYRASQTTPEVFELYRVPFATPGVSTKLNGSLTSGGDVTNAIVQ